MVLSQHRGNEACRAANIVAMRHMVLSQHRGNEAYGAQLGAQNRGASVVRCHRRVEHHFPLGVNARCSCVHVDAWTRERTAHAPRPSPHIPALCHQAPLLGGMQGVCASNASSHVCTACAPCQILFMLWIGETDFTDEVSWASGPLCRHSLTEL